jgi:Tfp pilus assembly protein PilZ
MTQDHVNRRRHERILAALPVRISTIEPERDPWSGKPFFRSLNETCANVSRGGAFVRTAEPLAPGRRILLELQLPSGVPLEAIGRVAWTKRVMTPRERDQESGIGIEFLGGAAEHFSALRQFIEKQSST